MDVDHFDLYVEDVDDGYEDRDFVMAAVFITPTWLIFYLTK